MRSFSACGAVKVYDEIVAFVFANEGPIMLPERTAVSVAGKRTAVQSKETMSGCIVSTFLR